MKPNYIFFYKNENKLEELLRKYPFREDVLNKKITKKQQIFEYEYFDLVCFKGNTINKNIRMIRTYSIVIDSEIYNNLEQGIIDEILIPMLSPCGTLLGKIEVL